MIKNKKNNAFSLLPVVLAVLVLGALGFVLLISTNQKEVTNSGLGDLPPAEDRINPNPQTANSVLVEKVEVGQEVYINEVTLAEDAYVIVEKQTNSGDIVFLGRSSLLESGQHKNIMIETQELMDGDIIYVSLQNMSGTKVEDDNGNVVEVLLNVGNLAGHSQIDPANDYY